MLSLSSSMQSQVFLPLSYVVSQFSSARKSSGRTSHKVKLEQRNKELNSKPEVACSIRNSNLVQDVRSAVDPSMLRQFALTGSLSQEQQLNPHISDSKTPWKVSHSSSFSFADNKKGFSSQPTSEIVTLTLSRKLLRQFQSSHLFYDSRRGFKTRQAIEKNLFEQQPLASRFKQSLKLKETGQVDAETKLKLGSLLREDGVEDPQKKIKLAFAEGYLAAEPNKKHTSKFMKFIQNIQNFVIFLTVVSLLFLVWGGLGGSMFRMHVGNGGEVHPEEIKVTFNDVKGVDEAKLELQEIVSFLKNPQKFKSLGAELPKGVLLVGPPGTGKTLLARAVAGEAGVPFFHAAGPEFDEILVGQGARRVRDLFQAAKLRAPCVIFIDEIDSVGAKRTNSVLHPYANQTINQLLSEMDGFHENEGVIILGATNRRDDLDKALLRPGRFDVEVQVPVPDLAGRKEIFDYYLGKIHYGNDVDVSTLGRGTTGFTGADIKNVVNQAALRAAADLLESVTMKYMEEARDKVLMGPERKSRIPDEDVNVITAYHEGGHAIVSYFTKHSCSLHKVTIIPRGPSLGHTAYIPEKEQYHRTRGEMLANMDSLMGGRVAEELIFGPEQLTSGSYSDLKRATLIATQMVKDFGMSDKVGLRTFEDTSNQLLKSGDSLSQTTKEAIDTEIKKLLNDSYERAKAILKAKSKEHKDLAEALLKYETLDAKDVKSILEGKSIRKT